MLTGRDGTLEMVEQEVHDGWVLDVVTDAPDELELRLTPDAGSNAGADPDGTTTTVVVRLTPTGIETQTSSRSTTGDR